MTIYAGLYIREIEINEHSICAGIYEKAWNSAFLAAQRTIGVREFKREVEGELTIVALLTERIVGYISIWKPEWFVHQLYVDPAHHGAGVGTALLSHAEKLSGQHPLSLKCNLANRDAISFYESRGFKEAGDSGTDEYGLWVRLESNAPDKGDQ